MVGLMKGGSVGGRGSIIIQDGVGLLRACGVRGAQGRVRWG